MMERRIAIRAITSVLALLVALVPAAVELAQTRTTATLQSKPSGDIPPVLYTSLTKQDRSYPTWVSADAAVDADGKVNSGYFHPIVAEDLRDLLLQSPTKDGCLQLGNVYTDIVNAPDRSSLTKAVRTSDLVILASVIDREYGFRFMEAGQLLTIRVEEVLRGNAKLDQYYIFVPIGHFQAGPYKICKSDSQFPGAPEVGDEVVVLVPEVEDPSEPYLNLVWDTSLVVIHSRDKVSFPRSYSDEPIADSRKELIQSLRSMGAGR